jgi:hypothetical protein
MKNIVPGVNFYYPVCRMVFQVYDYFLFHLNTIPTYLLPGYSDHQVKVSMINYKLI